MFPATITVALVTGFPVSTTLFSCGLATICCTLITRRKIPLFYGASFAYMSAIIALANSMGYHIENGIMPSEAIRIAQFGIMASGLVSIVAGFLIRYSQKEVINVVLPPHVTGSVSLIVGLSLAGNALGDMAPNKDHPQIVWLVGLTTFIVMVLVAVYCKGVFAQLPLLFGAIAGIIMAIIVNNMFSIQLFREIPEDLLNKSLLNVKLGGIISLPSFSIPKPSLTAIFAIMPMAIATIPESVSHVFQIDIYINDLARKKRANRVPIKEMLDLNLISDGIGDIVAGFIGGPAGTSYGENISVMTISNVFSTSVLLCAAVFVMVLSCFAPLIRVIYSIPLEVIGGLEIYMFGAIAVQGIAIMIEHHTNLFDVRNVAVISSILIIGLGGSYLYNGVIPFLGMNVPAIAGATTFGIILNIILYLPEIILKRCKR